MALLAGTMCGVRNDSCSRKHKYARTSHGIASESLSRGVDIFFCTGILFLETGTRASKRLKTGKNRRAFDDGSGLAAQGLVRKIFRGCIRTGYSYPSGIWAEAESSYCTQHGGKRVEPSLSEP